jgi:hypothetical protein
LFNNTRNDTLLSLIVDIRTLWQRNERGGGISMVHWSQILWPSYSIWSYHHCKGFTRSSLAISKDCAVVTGHNICHCAGMSMIFGIWSRKAQDMNAPSTIDLIEYSNISCCSVSIPKTLSKANESWNSLPWKQTQG